MRAGRPVKGPWPTPVQDQVEAVLVELADAHPQWGHRKLAEMTRITTGRRVAYSTALRALKRTGRVLSPDYTRQRRDLAAARRAAFLVPPSGPNQVWQLDFTEFETTRGGTWRISGCTDYWSKAELGWHVSMTQNHRDAISAIELALSEVERLHGNTLLDMVTDSDGQVHPVTVVTDNGPAFKAHRFARYIDSRPELIHIRTRRKTPQQNGVRERGFGSLKYEHLYRHEIPDGPTLATAVEDYRTLFNWIRPHEAIAMQRPMDLYLTPPQPAATPTQNEPENLPLS